MKRYFNIIRLIAGLALFVLLSLLVASTTYHPPLLTKWASQEISPYSNLYRAHLAGDADATELLSDLSAEHQKSHWQSLLAEHGVADAQYQLSAQAESKSERFYLLRQAASKGHEKALFRLAMLEDNPQQKVGYLKQAVDLDYLPAVNALYQWLWMQGQYEEALPLMKRIVDHDDEAALRLGQFFWNQSDYERSKSYLFQAKRLGNKRSDTYLKLIDKYWQKPINSDLTPNSNKSCNMRLQFVATGLDAAVQAEAFKAKFSEDEAMQQLPICINELHWANAKELNCDSQAVNNYRISCHLDKLDEALEPEGFTHLVVFHSRGKANVINGVMYLDLADKYSVFIHELAHFVGFIDEYPLGDGLVDFYCQAEGQFPNLFVVAPEKDISEVRLDEWQKHQQDMSISRARTCNNHENTAYKLSSKMTFMEFHDSGFIPPLYLAVWKERLQDPTNMKPAALNIAQALEEVGNSPAAQAWWIHFHQWRTESF